MNTDAPSDGPDGVATAGGSNRTVSRTAALLKSLHDQGGAARLSDLGKMLGVPRSSLYDLIRPLIAAAWLEKRPNGDVALGTEISVIGHSILSVPRMANIERAMQDAADDCHGVVALYASDGGETVALAVRTSLHGPHTKLIAGDRWAPNWTLPGRMLASGMSGQHLDFFLSAYARRKPGHPPQSPEETAAEITQLQAQHIATKSGEPEHHLSTCAVALRRDDTVHAVVSAIVKPEQTGSACETLDRLIKIVSVEEPA